MLMLSINKSLIGLASTNCLLNQKIRMNTISIKMNRFLRSTNSMTNQIIISCNQSTTQLSKNLCKIRCLSTNPTPKVIKILPIGQKTTKTSESVTELFKKTEQKDKQPAVEAIGIVGIHKWEDMKNVKEWICLYHFPYIIHLSTFQRLKLWLTVINFGFVPASLALYAHGSVDLEVVAYYSLVSLFSMFAMYIFGHLFGRFVGRIYVSNDGKYVRLSHLSFFGHREDTDFEREDVVPLMDTNNKINDWYCGIERYSTSYQLYMSLKFGGIVNREAFQQVFGEDALEFFNRMNRS